MQNISDHIKACDSCSKDFESLRKLKSALRNLSQVEPSQDYYDRFSRKLETYNESLRFVDAGVEQLHPSFRRIFIHTTTAAVAASVILAAGLFFFHHETTRRCFLEVSYVKGKVLIDNSSVSTSAEPQVAFVKRCINSGQTITTGPHAKVDFEVANRCKVTLREDSIVKIEKLREERNRFIMHCNLEKGAIIADVAKRKMQSDFQVATDLVNVKVVGTKFMVEKSLDFGVNNVSVAVLDGKVEVSRDVMLKGIATPERVYVAENNKMIFSQTGLVQHQNGLSNSDFAALYDVYNIGKRNIEVRYQTPPSSPRQPFRSEPQGR